MTLTMIITIPCVRPSVRHKPISQKSLHVELFITRISYSDECPLPRQRSNQNLRGYTCLGKVLKKNQVLLILADIELTLTFLVRYTYT